MCTWLGVEDILYGVPHITSKSTEPYLLGVGWEGGTDSWSCPRGAGLAAGHKIVVTISQYRRKVGAGSS